MDFDIVEILAAATLAWGVLRSETAYRRWRVAKMFSARKPGRKPDPAVSGITRKASVSLACDCGHDSNDFAHYTDGKIRCLECYGAEVNA